MDAHMDATSFLLYDRIGGVWLAQGGKTTQEAYDIVKLGASDMKKGEPVGHDQA